MISRDIAAIGLIAVGLSTWIASAPAAEPAPAAFNNHCRTCHSIRPDDHRVGPSLHNIHGAKAGSSSGYANYSQGLKSSGLTWDDATLEKFIENPDQVIPNNNMKPYSGIADADVRQQIVDYLRSQSSSDG